MKKIFLFLMLVLPMVASAQWNGYCKVPVSHTDTTVWCDDYRNKPFSLDIDYTSLNHAIKFAVVVSNWDNGAFSYFPFTGIVFPLTLDPTADAYTDDKGISHASHSFSGKDIRFSRFGIRITKLVPTTGLVKWKFKQ
jgi:hypothetical protein